MLRRISVFACIFAAAAIIMFCTDTARSDSAAGVDPATGLYYNESGKHDVSYTGFADSQFYISDDTRITEPFQWYVVKGVVAAGDGGEDWGFEGLYKDGNNVWRYYRYGKFQRTTTGFATDMTRYKAHGTIYRYRIENGLINFHFTGLAESGGNRYYEDGRWMNTMTDYVSVGDDMYYIRNGCVPTGDGKDDWGYEGLYKIDSVWRYFRYGKFQKTTSGFVTDATRLREQGRTYRYRIENGLINFHFTGIGETNRYYTDGAWQCDYSGTADIGGSTYSVSKGRIVTGSKTYWILDKRINQYGRTADDYGELVLEKSDGTVYGVRDYSRTGMLKFIFMTVTGEYRHCLYYTFTVGSRDAALSYMVYKDNSLVLFAETKIAAADMCTERDYEWAVRFNDTPESSSYVRELANTSCRLARRTWIGDLLSRCQGVTLEQLTGKESDI